MALPASLGVLFHVEMRPVPPGTWVFEDTRATYRGNVEITFRYPDQHSLDSAIHIAPLSFTVFMIYIMHIPTAYQARGHTPASSYASASTQLSAIAARMGPPAAVVGVPQFISAPIASLPVRAPVSTAGHRIRQLSVRPGAQLPAFRIEHVPSARSAEDFAYTTPTFRYGDVHIRPPFRPSGQIPSPMSSAGIAPQQLLDVPGPSTRLPPKKRGRVDVVIESSGDDEMDPSEGSC